MLPDPNKLFLEEGYLDCNFFSPNQSGLHKIEELRNSVIFCAMLVVDEGFKEQSKSAES